MTLTQLLATLASLAPAIEPLVAGLESQAQVELQGIIANVQSPDLKLLLSAIDGALDSFAKVEIAKL